MAPIPKDNTEDPSRSGNEVSDIETPPVNITIESDSSDEFGDDDGDVIGPANLGYQLLPQEPSAQGDSGGDEDQIQNPPTQQGDEPTAASLTIDSVITASLNQQDYPAVSSNMPEEMVDPEIEERKQLWSKPRSVPSAMAKEDADKIKAAMSGISLPPCAQPEWAKSVSEDEWKKKLYAKLNIPLKTDCSEDSSSGQVHLKHETKQEQLTASQDESPDT